MKKIITTAICLFFIMIFIIITVPQQIIIITHEDKVETWFKGNEGDTFTLSWIHSVEKEEWKETFIIKNKTIVLDSTQFKTFGAGVPNDVGNNTFLKDGWVFMINIDREIEEFFVRTGNDTKHELKSKYKHIILSKPNEERAYKISVEQLNILQFFFFLFK